ncbi:MAG: type III secretion system export apparatus subunit SctT [Desulfovibrionales bacterium]|nr:type III secretion system export apparatus subunit SctT [Desulfovibrionales bacterium]
MDDWQTPMTVFFICLVRIILIFRTAPFLAGEAVARNVRNTVCMSLVFLVYPVVRGEIDGELMLTPFLMVVVIKEAIIGLLIGYLLGLLFWTAEGMGFIIDNQRGASMASSLDPLSGQSSSPLGSMFFQTIVMLFFTTGAFVSFIGFVMHSYVTWPVFSFVPNLENKQLVDLFIDQFALLIKSVFVLAGPILIVCFLTDLGLGLINRFAPQLNVFFLSMPVKSGLALFVLIIYVRVLMRIFGKNISQMDVLFKVLQEAFQ